MRKRSRAEIDFSQSDKIILSSPSRHSTTNIFERSKIPLFDDEALKDVSPSNLFVNNLDGNFR